MLPTQRGTAVEARRNKSPLQLAFIAAAVCVAPTTIVAAGQDVMLEEVVVGAEHAPAAVPATSAATTFAAKTEAFDVAREHILPPLGATTYTVDRAAIEARPQGDNTPFDRLLLEAPGVSADSAASRPDFHIRNEYGNVQYRINGILLPDNLSGLGSIFDPSFIGSLTLLDGALPAQYGLRTAGVVDITARSFAEPGGSVGIYGGSHGLVTPAFDYGGISGATQYFVGLRGLRTDVGIENPTPSYNPVHDRSEQGRAFGYASTILSDSARLVTIAGFSDNETQIPNVPGQVPLGDFGGTALSSSAINERENNRFAFGLAALQTTDTKLDTQLSFYSRYAQVHFVPDVASDLAFTDVASDVSRRSVLTGTAFDAAYRLDPRQTLRFGVAASAEQTNNDNILTALPVFADGAVSPTPVTFYDNRSKLGVNAGGYAQDEIALTPTLTLNAGLRFDQLFQYVTTNQLSPRLALIWHPDPLTTLHVGYARYFTPPAQSEAAGSNIALANGTTLQAEVPLDSPVRPERSHYFDVGADHTVLPGLTLGTDLYLKLATNYIDDGEFGEARVVTQLNYARAYSEGAEFKAKYTQGSFTAYSNVSTSRAKVSGPNSNQYLLDADEFAYIASHYIFADDVQLLTASAGVSYSLDATLLTANLIYGSGLRSGFANLDHVPAYTQVNLGIAHDFRIGADPKPLTVRFDIVNAFDTIYQLRDGSGIGVDAPQYGPRRGFYVGLSKRL